MTDRHRSRAAHAESADPDREESAREDNPFAPPPEGRPDQPWRPRHQAGHDGPSREDGSGQDGESGRGRPGAGWGSRWSNSQPGRQGGGFGGPGQNGPDDRGDGPGPGGPRLRWDPTDPLQRNARYALHAGIWALFFALINVPEGAILLGLPALYWGAHALRGGKKADAASQAGARPEDVAGSDREPAAPTGASTATRLSPQVTVAPEQAARTRTAAAVSGLVAAGVALLVVIATFTVQQVYDDYFTCRNDALTTASRQQCSDLLPKDVRPFLTDRG